MSSAISVLDSVEPVGEKVSYLGRSACIQGKILSDQDLHLDGEVEGTIELHDHKLTIGPQARVRADIRAQNVCIVGTVEGTIEASDRIELCSPCRVVGQIKTRRIAIKDGAYFKGNIEVILPRSIVTIRPPASEGAGSDEMPAAG